MQGTMLYGPRDVRFEERPDPAIIEPTDAIIRLSATCVCGSDLWPYRGADPVTQPIPLLSGSPAIDAVPLADCTDDLGNPLTTDQRGAPRPHGPACDIGAFEGSIEPPTHRVFLPLIVR